MKSSILFLGALVATALAAPAVSGNHVLHERREVLPRSWNEARRVDGKAKLPMRIGMVQSNLDRAHELLMDVSHHKSTNYGKHYTAEEVHELFAPAADSVSAVRNWLESAGIEASRISQSVNKQWMQFDADADEVERLLRTEYYIYDSEETGNSHLGCEEYYVPEHVRGHIDYITPGIKSLAVANPHRSRLGKRIFDWQHPQEPLKKDLPVSLDTLVEWALDLLSPTCDVAITPNCIKTLYNITDGTTATPGNELGVFEDLADYYSQDDLNLFFESLASNIPQGTHPTLNGIDGGTAPTTDVTEAGPESDLDFQISYPIIWPQNSILFQTDDPVYEANYTFSGFLNTFLDGIDGSYCTYSAFGETGDAPYDPSYPDPASGGYKSALQCGAYKPTNVISISYGGDEASLPDSYQQRQCNEYMKLGLQGVTVVVASGDSGVGPSSGSCLGSKGNIFVPDFPATCPYLLSVGATYLPPGGSASEDQEVAVTRFASGGGFSNIYAIPDYQQTAVANYFKTSNPSYPYYESVNNNSFGANGGLYNRAGRGYPDVAAIGDNVAIFNAGAPTLIGGTSASAPTFASILTRINEELLAKGKPTVGFVNPILYAHPEVFHDITTGNNPGCGTNGFSVAAGWDPVTGLGTPDYPSLLNLFLSQ